MVSTIVNEASAVVRNRFVLCGARKRKKAYTSGFKIK